MVEQAQKSEGERILNEQVAEISKLDPSIKTLADIKGMKTCLLYTSRCV